MCFLMLETAIGLARSRVHAILWFPCISFMCGRALKGTQKTSNISHHSKSGRTSAEPTTQKFSMIFEGKEWTVALRSKVSTPHPAEIIIVL